MRSTLAEEKSYSLHLSTADGELPPLILNALRYETSSVSNLEFSGLFSSCHRFAGRH